MNAEAITAAALQCLDDDGLDRLTMRSVAGRLGVQVGGLYYHVPDKAALLRLMADRLCAEVLDGLGPAPDADRSAGVPADSASGGLALCLVLREVLLAHRDGARILAGIPLVASQRALEMMERLMAALAGGVAEPRVAPCADALMSYVTGYVLQEQHGPPVGLAASAVQELSVRFPRVFAGASTGASSEQTFRLCVGAIIAGFAHRAP